MPRRRRASKHGQPVLFEFEGVHFLPIFTSIGKFADAMIQTFAPARRDEIKPQVITDHAEFIDSVAGKVRLMLDPWITEAGTTRFTELRPDGLED